MPVELLQILRIAFEGRAVEIGPRAPILRAVVQVRLHQEDFRRAVLLGGPVVGAAMCKIGGDAPVRAMEINGERVRRSLSMTPGERRRENIAQESFWGAPTKNRYRESRPRRIPDALPKRHVVVPTFDPREPQIKELRVCWR